MSTRNIIKVLISLIIISAILFYLYYNGYFEIVNSITVIDWTILLGVTLLSFMLSGLQMRYLIKWISGKGISAGDVLFMPMSMSLFGYIIPINGGLLYSLYYMKKKYNVETAHGFSVGVVTIYLSFIISGLALLIASFVIGIIEWYLIGIALVLILSPLLVAIANYGLQKIPFRAGSMADRACKYLNSVVVNANVMIANKKVTAYNFVFTLFSLFLFFVMYYELNIALEMNLSILSLLALLAMMRISSLIRVLPGNLGLEELFTAGLFGIIGHDPAVGLVFSVFLRFCSVMIMIPVGITHTVLNTQYFSLKDLRQISLKKKKDSTPPAENP